MGSKWDRRSVLVLIEAYKCNACLWDYKHPSYKDRHFKEMAYKYVHSELQKVDDSLTMDEIKKKIHCLRTQFRREMRLKSRADDSGIFANKRTLWCYDKLEFLKEAFNSWDGQSRVM